MHIPDAVLDPRTSIVTGAIAAAGLAVCVAKLRHHLRDRTTVLMGIASACIYAAQGVNFPIGAVAASGHLLGGVLAAVLLGPWAGASVMATVLIVQCLLNGDGGLTALGANFLNMGLVGSVVGYAIYAPIRRAIGGPRGILIGSMAAAWFTVILASGAFAVELAASGRRSDFVEVLTWMVLIHALIGLGEALITGLVVRFLLQVRPDLIYDAGTLATPRPIRAVQTAVAGLGISLAVAIFAAPLASTYDDGLETVGRWFRFIDEEKAAEPVVRPLIPDYQLPGVEREGVRFTKGLAVSLGGAVGTLVVFGAACVLSGAVAGRGGRPRPAVPDAA